MKLNGALKPRQGASCSKGSSPGAEQLRKYRDKEQQRYPRTITVNKETTTTTTTFYKSNNNKQQRHHDVVDDNDNDDDDDYDDDNNDNDNDDCGVNKQENNQSEHTQPQQEPQFKRSFKRCVKNSLSSKQGLFNVNHNKTLTENRIKSVTEITRITSATNTEAATVFAGSRHRSREVTKENEAHDNTSEKGEFEKNDDEDFDSNTRKLKQINITTRQITNNINKRNSQGINKQKQEHKGHSVNTANTISSATAQNEEREQFAIANSHVTKPNKENNSNSNTNTNSSQPTTLILASRSLSWKEDALENNNKWSFSSIYDSYPILWSPHLSASLIISSIFKQFMRFWISLTCLMFSPNGYPVVGAAISSGRNVANMRASQSFCSKNVFKSRPRVTVTRGNTTTPRPLTSSGLCWLLVYGAAAVTLLSPQSARADDGDNFFSPNGIAIGETTTAEFDYASRGQKKFGDKCDNTLECGFPGSVCDAKKKSCRCTDDLPVTNHIDKCGKGATVNESCFFNEQCESVYLQTECRDGRCVCRFDMAPIWLKDGNVECKGRGDQKTPETYIDPAMIGVLIGMALMFIIICVVLRLFSQARWRENRTIFNTPNPRLMNVSLLRESKLLHGQERRGSRMSVRAPSRQPSMASLRPHSPNPSLGKTGRMTRSKSNTRSSDSRVSDVSNCSRLLEHNTHHPHHHNAMHPHAANNTQLTTGASASGASASAGNGPSPGIHSASVSPLLTSASALTPTTTITYVSENPVAGTACSTNQTLTTPTPPPATAITIKSNKF